MSNFTPNEEQEKAFNAVSRAIKRAQKKGLVFYGKNSSLVAYTRAADAYIEEDFDGSLGTGFSQIDNLNQLGLLSDCGSDDYGAFRTAEDEEKYTEKAS